MLTLTLTLLCSLVAVTFGQTCQGNGFVGECGSYHDLTGIPTGLSELIGSPSVTQVCEGDLLAVTHDCENRVPLWVTVKANQTWILNSNPGRCDPCDFRPSPNLLATEQAADNDYDSANDRIPCYERKSDGQQYRDQFWTTAGPDEPCSGSSEPHTGTSRGHMIADSYVRFGNDYKDATYHFTNCIPQYQKFNNEAWNLAEQQVFNWAEDQCSSAIPDPTVRSNAYMHLMVGAIPSTSVDQVFTYPNVEPRWFGEWGFGDEVFNSTVTYNGGTPAYNAEYRVNMPAAMWTAACCIGTDANNNVQHVRHMAFARHAGPVGNDDDVVRDAWPTLFQAMLPNLDTTGVDLFPAEPLCGDPANYVTLPEP